MQKRFNTGSIVHESVLLKRFGTGSIVHESVMQKRFSTSSIVHRYNCAPVNIYLNNIPIETLMVTNKHLIYVRYIYTVKWERNEILLIKFYIHWCTVVTVHNRAGAKLFLHNRFVHNRAGAESFLHNRCVHNRAGAESFLHNRFVHNRAGAESFLHNRCVHNRADAESFLQNRFVHNRSVPDRSCWIGTVQNRAVLDRYHPERGLLEKNRSGSKILGGKNPRKNGPRKSVLCWRNDHKIYRGKLNNFFISIDRSHPTTSHTPNCANGRARTIFPGSFYRDLIPCIVLLSKKKTKQTKKHRFVYERVSY